MKKATKILLGVLAVLFVAWLGTSLFFTLAGGGDLPPPEEPSGGDRPASENVYTHLRELVDSLPKWDNRWSCLSDARTRRRDMAQFHERLCRRAV